MRNLLVTAMALMAFPMTATAQTSVHTATLLKLEIAAEVCRTTAGLPPTTFAQVAERGGFTQNAARGWWQWNSSDVGPSMIVTQQPNESRSQCRIILQPAGLTREQIANAVFAWAEKTGFAPEREPPSSETGVSLALGDTREGLFLNLWVSSAGNFLLDFK